MFKSVKFRAKCLIKTTVPLYQHSRSLLFMHVPTTVIPHGILKKLFLLGQISIWNLTSIFCVISFCLVSIFPPTTNSILRAVDLGNPGSYLPCFDRFVSQAVLPLLAVKNCIIPFASKKIKKRKEWSLNILNWALSIMPLATPIIWEMLSCALPNPMLDKKALLTHLVTVLEGPE